MFALYQGIDSHGLIWGRNQDPGWLTDEVSGAMGQFALTQNCIGKVQRKNHDPKQLKLLWVGIRLDADHFNVKKIDFLFCGMSAILPLGGEAFVPHTEHSLVDRAREFKKSASLHFCLWSTAT